MAPAHQRFQPDDLPRAQVQPRLVMQLQFVTAQSPAQLAFEVGQAAGVAIDTFVEYVKSAALGAFSLLHGNVCVPHQRVGPGVGAGVGDAQATADQQALTVNPVGLGHHLGDALGHPFGAFRRTMGVDQQGEFVAAQPGQLVAGLKLAFEARHHLQDQPIARLMAQCVVGVAKVVQVQVAQGYTATVAFSQAHGQQGLETLTVGDAGQRVFFGKTLQRVLQQAAFTHMAQAAAQHIAGQAGAHQPVADARRGARRFAVEQQNRGQAAAAR